MKEIELREWLYDLSRATTTPTPPAIRTPIEGSIPLANMFFCLQLGLIEPETLRSFLELCIIDSSSGGAGFQFDHRCRLDDPSKLAFVALKRVKLTRANPRELYSTAIPTDRFHRYILHRDYKSYLPGRTPVGGLPPNPRNVKEENAWIDTLQTVARKNLNWAKPGAHLGSPYSKPSSAPQLILCWFTKRDMADRVISASSSREDRANALRDALGLIEYVSGRCLLIITFPKEALLSLPGLAVAQPTFADGAGAKNRRFAASQPGTTHVVNLRSEWGSTVDLGKFAKGLANACGMPERISHPVPINDAVFKVEYVGRLTSARGDSSVDDDARFAAWLRDPHTVDDMIDYVVAQVVK